MAASFREVSATVKRILDLSSEPVGVKFLSGGEGPHAAGGVKLRYCQSLMKARRGEEVVLTPDNISCPAAAAAFGFTDLPPRIASGEVLFSLGLFRDPSAARATMRHMPRLERAVFPG